MNLKDKICLITGSANGIGEKCAFKFAEYGARLILIDQDEKITSISKLLEKKYNRKVKFIVGDITSKKVLNLMETTIINDFKRIDILFNNAGVIRLSDDISKLEEKDWDLQVNVNLKSIYLVLQKIIPIMKNQNFGNILNTASMTGSVVGMSGLAGYCASKGGVIGLTKCVALELAKYNIRCNAVSPGAIDTDFYNVLSEELKSEMSSAVVFPFMTIGGTDSQFFQTKGVNCYGLIPILVTEDDIHTMHGIDERISIDNFMFGTKIVYNTVKRTCSNEL